MRLIAPVSPDRQIVPPSPKHAPPSPTRVEVERRRDIGVTILAVLLAAATLAACNSGTEERSEVSATRVVMRPNTPVPPGTVPRGSGAYAAALATPGPGVTQDLLRRGQGRFMVFCSPCHGAGGYGDGIVVSRGFPAPPSYHLERLRKVPPEHIVSVVTNGLGLMYPHAERIPPEDRWAIAHYVKALQAGVIPDPDGMPP